jgi:hypothetical protein
MCCTAKPFHLLQRPAPLTSLLLMQLGYDWLLYPPMLVPCVLLQFQVHVRYKNPPSAAIVGA